MRCGGALIGITLAAVRVGKQAGHPTIHQNQGGPHLAHNHISATPAGQKQQQCPISEIEISNDTNNNEEKQDFLKPAKRDTVV